MSQTLLRTTKSRRLTSVLMATAFGLSLAVAPPAATEASAAGGISAAQGQRALRVAAQQYGIRYVWGGTSRRGFDCSGLTQYSFAKIGKRIPRVAQAQYNASIKLRPRMQRAGDLVFFGAPRNVYHVGMYAGNGYMINAAKPGTRVKKQKIWTTNVRYGRVR
jgi:cell wall-associated NlpC family hydrolase